MYRHDVQLSDLKLGSKYQVYPQNALSDAIILSFIGWCCEAALLKPSTVGLHWLSGWHCQGVGLEEWPVCERMAWALGSDP